jgi:transcriptional regulator with XRE-family HTH domain
MSKRSLKHQSGREPHLTLVPAQQAHKAPAVNASSPEAFCASLKAVRESRGIPLAVIAEQTKIGSGLLAALERGNVSRWPGGIYRRAFFTAYAEAIGVPAQPAVAEFLRLFPDADEDDVEAPPVERAQVEAGRLALAGAPRPVSRRIHARVREAALVLLVALTVALAATPLTDATAWLVAIVVAGWYGRPMVTALRRHRYSA